MIRPESPKQLAETLRDLAAQGRPIHLGGTFSKDRLGGPLAGDAATPATVSTASMKRLLEYEPRDLTVSVEAGMSWAELERTLASRGQMLPLDPGWSGASTVGGVIAANLSGPRRRLYGTARDMIIGMTFATLEGKLIRCGGMVVKNVAGLDMAKLMIGSFGTLAAMATVNFKVFPTPLESRTFVTEFETAAEAFAERDRILRGVLQPSAIDIVNLAGGIQLLARVGGSSGVMERYVREFPKARVLTGDEEAALWEEVREFTPRFLARNPQGGVETISTTLTAMREVAGPLRAPWIARAGSGVFYVYHAQNPPDARLSGDFEMMAKVKDMFDPRRLLNRGRLYGRI